MKVYQGVHRRQVGGGIWSTISRGIRPIIFNLIKTLKPHAATAAKRVAQSATRVGTDMAMDALHGKFDKQRLKNTIKQEARDISKDTLYTLKRKIDSQLGNGNKRRKLNPNNKNIKMPKKRRVSRKSKCAKRHTTKRKRVSRKSTKRNKRRQSRGIKKKKSKQRSVSRRIIKDIFHS